MQKQEPIHISLVLWDAINQYLQKQPPEVLYEKR